MTRPEPAAATTPPAARDLIERQLAMLARLAEIGMELAEAAGRTAAAGAGAGEAAPHAPDPTLAFARAARAVRLTIALQSRLIGDLAALDRGETLARTAEAARRRDRVHRLVERAIEAARPADPDDAEADHEDEIERLSAHAWERLTEADDAELTDRPLAEVVARICEDLGLPPQAFAAPFAPEAAFGPISFESGDPAQAAVRPMFAPVASGSGSAFADAAARRPARPRLRLSG